MKNSAKLMPYDFIELKVVGKQKSVKLENYKLLGTPLNTLLDDYL